MTEKRFKLIDGIKKGTHSGIWDNQKQHNMGIGDELWLGEVVGMLNEGVILAEETTNLKEENEQLKDALNQRTDQCDKYYKKNEQLKQFKSKVLELLDEKIKHYEHKPFSAPISQPLSVNFDADMDRLARLSELEALKEELQE